ncbi:fungal-specific transcription factor domain-containing protein [Calycina marina]|uniref:Fungal-specific transcription factor domain-containing protein n=1 Tax=Calycina marina TaxID=1763456 RepID=A0A9P8CIU4_9HELO|nr:fungal-specific transcription factor domain-containing protein [Calycina marina]
MTLPVACPTSSCSGSDPPTVPQRKRRRRAPASGATDDCFTCTKRNLKCDRRRPYCSQCLEFGKECSGYKTQLTWGVGVASRGKLRGLSLPVARSAPVAKSPPVSGNRQRTLSTASVHREDVKIKLESALSSEPFTNYDFVNMAPHGVTNPPLHQIPDWNMDASHEYPIQDYHQPDGMSHQRQLPQLHRLNTLQLSLGRDNMGTSSSLDSINSAYADSDYNSPLSRSYQNDDIPFLQSPVPVYGSYSTRDSVPHSPVAGMMSDPRGGPTSCPDPYYAQSEISSSISSHQNLYDIAESRQHQPSPSTNEVFYDDDMLGHQHVHEIDAYATSARSSHFGWTSVNDSEEAVSHPPSEADAAYRLDHESHDSTSSTTSVDLTPRISFFLDYYEKIICPSVVVLDSPSNPYREHILSLANTSQSLTHAICALAACNLRMKRKRSLGQNHWSHQPFEFDLQDHSYGGHSRSRPTCVRRTSHLPMSPDATNDSSIQEEYQHRSLAVSLLNQQLSDPSKTRHDCVLATLFILCHYRMCESGIAQFRTQFAGVKKILGIRDSGLETGNWGWMETLFTYFDGIAASINDREAQLRGGYVSMIAETHPNPNHALENMAGCDSQLFKTIARLGRLNLLSQHRPVLADPTQASLECLASRRESPPQPRSGLAGQALADFYNLHGHSFDGNGFASLIDDDATFPLLKSTTSHEDLRSTFWAEWKAARNALQEWEFDPSRLLPTLPTTPTPAQLRDFGYISEAFRYSALIYTERLACPNLPSSHLNFQNLVSQVLYYITSLEQGSGCEKFLLWPLFISGSECVNELHQGIVRGKCRGIMSRSGYLNNLAGLDVLEKLWTEKEDRIGDQEKDSCPGIGGPFRWTKYMEGDGEWIMV